MVAGAYQIGGTVGTWVIEGANRKDGREVVERIDAASEAGAREEAGRRGILVASVARAREGVQGDGPHGAALAAAWEEARGRKREEGELADVTPDVVRFNPPGYRGIQRCAVVLQVLGAGFALLAALLAVTFVLAMVGLINGGSSSRDSGSGAAFAIVGTWVFASLLVPCLSCALASAILFIASFVSLAVRDLARNSYRLLGARGA
jgi:hypothetical protein